MAVSEYGSFECDYCKRDKGFAQWYSETGNHVECQDRASLRSELQDILDLLRTGMAPMFFGMTEQQWLEHKCNKSASKLSALIEKMSVEK